MIRTILTAILAALLLIISLPVLGIEWLIRKKWPHFGDRSGFRYIQFIFRALWIPLGLRLEVIGRENIPQDRPCLFIGNHRSYLDVFVTYPFLPFLTGFVAKNDFEKFPIMPIWMRRLSCEFLVKDDLKQNLKAILSAIDSVKAGNSMFIYPEGQRSTQPDETELLEFHAGSFKIATKTGCPIIPVAVSGTRECFEAHFPKATSGHIILEFGKPVETSQLSKEELKKLNVTCRRTISDMVKKNHAKL